MGLAALVTTMALASSCDSDTNGPAGEGGGGGTAGIDAGTAGVGGNGAHGGSVQTDAGGGADAGDAAQNPDADIPDADGSTDASPPPRQPLDPTTIPKYVMPLVIPPVMPPVAEGAIDEYEIAVRQFEQQVLPSGFPKTTVWGYGNAGDPLPGTGAPSTFNYPAFTVETRSGETVRVKWINGLVDDAGHFLPHLFAVDQTVHWANPPGPIDQETLDPTAYRGPVPIVTHVHGADVPSVSDGNPEAWYLPDANDIPSGYTRKGGHYGSVIPTDPGAAVFEYPNTQRAATLWYHDHALGITRLNVQAGMAGFWIIRDAEEDALGLPGPAPKLGDEPGTRYYEIPIVIQDRSFYEDGSLRYPTSREEFDGYAGPYIPEIPISPIWNPEVFGDVMVVNGRTWPVLDVEPRLYRFRIINGTNSRFLDLEFEDASLAFNQIGAEGGLLSEVSVVRTEVLMGPAERADVIVDFSSLAVGTEVILRNLGPDEPFKGPSEELAPADPETTGQVMKFRVVAASDAGTPGSVPTTLPSLPPLTTALPPRDLALNEDIYEPLDIPREAKLGTLAEGPLDWDDPITEMPVQGDTEIWRFINFTADAHPIHLHLAMFRVLDRRPFDPEAFEDAKADAGAAPPSIDAFYTAPARPAEAWESGWKDTVVANPGEVTRVIATFERAGLYLWHCHILEHEDNEMMRPYVVLPGPGAPADGGL